MSTEAPNVDTTHGSTVDIKLLGPAQEFSPPGVQLSAVPTATTIAELKLRINQTISTHPPVECLRIISHGRACRDNEHLFEIFSRTTTSEDSGFRVLHVVISDPSNPRFPQLSQSRPQSVPPIARSESSGQNGQSRSSTSAGPHVEIGTDRSQQSNHMHHHLQAHAVPHSHLHQHTHSHSQRHPHNQQNAQPPLHEPAGHQNVQFGVNPSEFVNGLLNQQFVGQHLAAVQAQLPQLLQSLPGMLMPQMVPGMPPTEVPRIGSPISNGQSQRVQHTSHQSSLDGAMPASAAAFQNHSSTPSTTPVSAVGNQQAQPALSNTPLNSSTQPMSAQSTQPGPSTQQITSTDANGRQYTVTVQSSVFNLGSGQQPGLPNLAFPRAGTMHMHPSMVTGHLGAFAQPLQSMQPGVRLSPSPGVVMPGVTPPPTSASADQIPANIQDREEFISNRMLFLSTELYNIITRIQALGGRMSSTQTQAYIRHGVMRDSINFLQVIEELDNRLRFFDTQASQVVAIHPDVTSNTQYIQTQIRRRGAGAALSTLYEIIRNEIMTPTLQTSVSQAIAPFPIVQSQQSVSSQSPPQSTQEFQAPTGLATSTTVPTTVPTTTVPATSPNPQVFILNDPRGAPYALLVGPNGQHSSQPLPWNILQPLLAARIPAVTLARAIYHATGGAYSQTINSVRAHDHNSNSAASLAEMRNLAAFPAVRPRGQRPVNGSNVQATAPPNAVAGAGAGHEQPAREPDEMRDMLAPIIRNLWLLVRIAGFTYFLFGGGRALWRPLILAGILTVIWAAQAGIFGDRFDGVRRYLDRLVGIDQQARQGADAEHNANRPESANQNALRQQNTSVEVQANGQPRTNGAEPRPEDAASRLIAQQQQQMEMTWFMQRVRYIERMFGLFFASLWPGIGEQAVRLQAERERRVREAQQAREAQIAAAAAAEASASNPIEEDVAEAPHTSHSPEPAKNSAASTPAMTDTTLSTATGSDPASSESSSLGRVNKGKARAFEEQSEA